MKHWTKGGQGVTQFDKCDRHLYEKAIAHYGDPALYIKGGWLACSHNRDLSKFWRIFDALYAKAKGE